MAYSDLSQIFDNLIEETNETLGGILQVVGGLYGAVRRVLRMIIGNELLLSQGVVINRRV